MDEEKLKIHYCPKCRKYFDWDEMEYYKSVKISTWEKEYGPFALDRSNTAKTVCKTCYQLLKLKE